MMDTAGEEVGRAFWYPGGAGGRGVDGKHSYSGGRRRGLGGKNGLLLMID